MPRRHPKLTLLLCALLLAWLFPSSVCALEGRWRGNLSVQQTRLPLVFAFSRSANDAAPSCTLDSPLQGVTGMAATVTHCSPDSIAIEIPSIRASFRGKITPAEISGTFSQSGLSLPLTLTPEPSLSERRPQTPRPPFPYSVTDTVFPAADGVLLAGTLVMPLSPAKGNPAVVMISGSGPQNRDEELFDHRPFAVIADFLARNGIASFRYDDRGTAQSGGDFSATDLEQLRSDAAAALTFARSLLPPRSAVGLLGHSEGATLALMLAAEGKAAFVVSLAAATVKGKDLLLEQNARALRKLPLTPGQTADALRLISLTFDDIIAGKDYADIPLDRYISNSNLDITPTLLASLRQNLAATSGTTYFRQLLSLDPSAWIGKIKCEVLALNGTLDSQVNCQENLQTLRANLPGVTAIAYPGLNHLFQHAQTGEITEYADISETISPRVLSDITAFILSLCKK